MKRLIREKQTQIVLALIEGNSLRATSRMFGVSKDTVMKLQVEAGYASADYQDKNIRGLNSRRVQCDEVWSFCYAKQKNVPDEKQGKFGYGDVWTWTAIDADSKLIVSFTGGTETRLRREDGVREIVGGERRFDSFYATIS